MTLERLDSLCCGEGTELRNKARPKPSQLQRQLKTESLPVLSDSVQDFESPPSDLGTINSITELSYCIRERHGQSVRS